MRKFSSAFALANRRLRAITGCRRDPVRITNGSRGTGIQCVGATCGVTATGRGRPAPARIGCRRTTTVGSTTLDTGTAVTATVATTTTAMIIGIAGKRPRWSLRWEPAGRERVYPPDDHRHHTLRVSFRIPDSATMLG